MYLELAVKGPSHCLGMAAPHPSALAFHYAFALECISFSYLKVHIPSNYPDKVIEMPA